MAQHPNWDHNLSMQTAKLKIGFTFLQVHLKEKKRKENKTPYMTQTKCSHYL